jgi:hypothetical protein
MCQPQTEEFFTTIAKQGKSQRARAAFTLEALRDLGFSRATLPPAIEGKLEVLR